MERIKPDLIKSWVAKKPGKRDWLADQCHVSKSTVDGWLSSGRPIPGPAMSIIRDLMEGRTVLNPRISLRTFSRAQEIAAENNLTLDEWIEGLIELEVEKADLDSPRKNWSEGPPPDPGLNEDPPDYGGNRKTSGD